MSSTRRTTTPTKRLAQFRHAKHYVNITQAADQLYQAGGDQVRAVLDQFDNDRPQLDVARTWLQAQPTQTDSNALLILAADGAAHINELRYTAAERAPHIHAAFQAARHLGNRVAQAVLLGHLGTAYMEMGELPRAINCYEQALLIAREQGDRSGEAAALGNLGASYAALGDARRALGYYEQRLAIARAIGDRRGEAETLDNQGLAYAALGELPRAISCYEQRLRIAHELGDRRGEAAALINLGNACAALGELPRAITLHERARVIAQALGDRRTKGTALGNLGNAYDAAGDVPRAIACYEEHLAIAHELGDRRGAAETSWNMGSLLAQRGAPAQALPFLEASLRYHQEIDHPRAVGMAAALAYLRHHGTLPADAPAPATAPPPHAESHVPATLGDATPAAPVVPPHAPTDLDRLVQNLVPLLGDIALAAHGDAYARQVADAALPQFEAQGLRLSAAVLRIWQGERDMATLAADIDLPAAHLVRHILRLVADGPALIVATPSQQLADLFRQVEGAVADALAGDDAAARVKLAQQFVELAGEAEHQPALLRPALADFLRAQAARLQEAGG